MNSSFCGFEFNHNNSCIIFFSWQQPNGNLQLVDGTQCVVATSKSNPEFENVGLDNAHGLFKQANTTSSLF
jgi:hypothetical protein